MTTQDPRDAQPADEAPEPDLPFDKDDLTFGPDDVVHNSDADPDAESDPDDPGATAD